MSALELRIREVATWIKFVNPQFECNYFRSEQVRPGNKIKIKREFSLADSQVLFEVVIKRRAILEVAGVSLVSLEEALSYGALIYTCPSDSTFDGGAEYYSQGLVDIWEIPAWDTWVALGSQEFNEFEAYKNCIISWIPESVYDLFYSGKEVGLEDNLGWVIHLFGNSELVNWVTAPVYLKFIEVTDQKLVEDRLKRINQLSIVESETTRANNTVTGISSGNLRFWNKIKQYFS